MSPQEPPAPTPKGSFGALLRHGATYSLVPIFGNVISIVMISFFTDWLHEDEMGVSQIIDLVLAFSLEFLGVSALQGMVRYYFEHTEERDKNAVVSSTILVGAAVSWAVVGLCLLFSGSLRPILLSDEPTAAVTAEYLDQVFFLALLLVPFQMTTQASFRYLMIHHRSGLFSGIQAVKMISELALKIWFVAPESVLPFGLGMGVKGILLSVLAGEVVTSTLLGGSILKKIGWRIDWVVFKPILVYSWPLIVASLYHLALQRSDLRLIELLVPVGTGLAAAGVYGIGYKVGYLANQLLLGPFLQVFLPWIYEVDDEAERTDLIARVTVYLLVVVGIADIAVSCFARELILVLDQSEGHEYATAYRLVPFVCGAYVFWAIYKSIGETSFYVAKRTRALSWLSFVALAINIGLNVWLIPRYGIISAAISTLVAYAVLAVLGEVGRYRLLEQKMSYRRILLCLATVAVACTGGGLVDHLLTEPGLFSLQAALLKAPIVLAAAVFFWQVVLYREERMELRAWIASKLGR